MPAATETVTYDQLFSLTGRARKPRVTDNIGNSQPTLDILHAGGRVEIEDGGESIEERLMYAEQDTEWMSDRQRVSTDDKEMITKAVFPWRFIVAPVNISKTDELKAQKSETAAMDFAESKIIGARQGIRTGTGTALGGSQSGKSMLGFQDVIKNTPTSGTLGGINQATNTWFRNKYYNTAVTFTTQTVTNIFDGWDQVGTQYEAASDMNEEVTHIVSGETLYQKMLSTLEGQGYTRFMGGGQVKMGAVTGGGQNVGQGPMFRGALIYKDRSMPASTIYGYSLSALKLKIMKGANFAKTNFVATDASGVIGKVCFYIVGIQLVTINPRRTFVMNAVS